MKNKQRNILLYTINTIDAYHDSKIFYFLSLIYFIFIFRGEKSKKKKNETSSSSLLNLDNSIELDAGLSIIF